ncbi:hypothetical protein [Massilia sp. CCM 8734]|uniref:hypothetical protein n=1 Tax=Massilia sp. CCM 8734 TaxID=2609283 RepID=UPI00141E6AB0|nr:hypothetical protein [Massilia sp. CCM 8734]NHZ94621.1 hypothetical protein [Massilia sp. CCM 8734]
MIACDKLVADLEAERNHRKMLAAALTQANAEIAQLAAALKLARIALSNSNPVLDLAKNWEAHENAETAARNALTAIGVL